jgi:hypothetical protein
MKTILLLYLLLVFPSPTEAQESIDRRVAQMQEKLGDSYRARRDEELKVVILSDLSDKDIDDYLERLRLYEHALHATFFDHLPDYWILVLIPSSADDYNRKLGGQSGNAGFYESGTHTLTVNLATGTGTVVHEWTHALNIADQTARGQSQPLWMLEGFGSLYEQAGIRNGRPMGFTNWRLPQVQSMIQNGTVRPMRDFIMDSKKYFDQDPVAAYAQTRYIFYYLQETDLLQKFYRAYVDGYAEDTTGIVALEKVLGKKVEDWTREWKTFTMDLTFGDIRPRPTIGVQLDASAGRLRVSRVVEDSGADKAGVRAEDVIIGADGQRSPSVDDLQKILASKKTGDEIILKLIRGGREQEIKVTLQ